MQMDVGKYSLSHKLDSTHTLSDGIFHGYMLHILDMEKVNARRKLQQREEYVLVKKKLQQREEYVVVLGSMWRFNTNRFIGERRSCNRMTNTMTGFPDGSKKWNYMIPI